MLAKITVLLSLHVTVLAEEKPFLDLKKVIRVRIFYHFYLMTNLINQLLLKIQKKKKKEKNEAFPIVFLKRNKKIFREVTFNYITIFFPILVFPLFISAADFY